MKKVISLKVDEEGNFSAANGNFTVDADGTTYAHANRSELQVTENQAVLRHGDNGVIVNKDGVSVAGKMQVDKVDIGTISVADGKFTVDENGQFTANAGVNGGIIGISADDAVLGYRGNSIVMNRTGATITSGKLTITNGTDETVINGKYINGVYMRTEGNDVWANNINISALGSNSEGIANGNFQVAENGSVTNTIKDVVGTTVSTITTDENGLTVTDQNGSTVVNGSGVTTTGDGNFGGDVNVGGFLDVEGGAHIGGDLIVDGTINGKDFNDLATSEDISGVKGEITDVSNKVNAVDSKVGDTTKLDKTITERQEYKDNQSLVGAINAESAMRQKLDNDVKALDGRVSNLEDRMGDVEDRIDKVGAMAAAIANLRTMGYDPEAPTEIAVGVGQYESETGLALGVFHYPNQDFMLSASISTSGDEVMGGIGATWKIGRKSAAEKARSVEEKRVAKAEEMQEMAKAEKVKAQRERHAQMLAEREAAK